MNDVTAESISSSSSSLPPGVSSLTKRIAPLFLTLSVLVLIADRSHAEDWSFQLAPYFLATTIKGDAGIGRVTGADVEVDLTDILEVPDIDAMVHFEAHHGSGWGIVLDYGLMDLGEDISGSRRGVVDVEVRQGVLEALAVRRFAAGKGRVEILAGVRWWDNDLDVTIDPAILPGHVLADVEEDWVDPIVSVRWSSPLNDSWSYHVRGTVGGLGLESDFTSSVAVGFHYQISDSIDLDLQYKATRVDFETGSRGQPEYFRYDTVTHGPLVGVIFNF